MLPSKDSSMRSFYWPFRCVWHDDLRFHFLFFILESLKSLNSKSSNDYRELIMVLLLELMIIYLGLRITKYYFIFSLTLWIPWMNSISGYSLTVYVNPNGYPKEEVWSVSKSDVYNAKYWWNWKCHIVALLSKMLLKLCNVPICVGFPKFGLSSTL